MAYCVQCGNQVGDRDRYCGKCGASQAVPPGAAAPNPFDKMNNRDAATLCYIPWIGWIFAIVVLASGRYRNDHSTRFHAFQGLYLFVAWLLIDWVVAPLFHFPAPFPLRSISGLLRLGVVAAWIFMIVKVRTGEYFRLPIIGDLAERSAQEQHA
jgi:uncharacterized membrane protein